MKEINTILILVNKQMLNLGNLYRSMKDFQDTQSYLNEELNRVKVGNKYWKGLDI